MNRYEHHFSWTVSVAPQTLQTQDRPRVAVPGGTLRFAFLCAAVAFFSLATLCFAQDLELHAWEAPFVVAGAMLFAYKYDAHDEPRYDAPARHFLYLAMPMFVAMACMLANFSAQHHDAWSATPIGALFVGLLGLQSALTLLAHLLLRLFA